MAAIGGHPNARFNLAIIEGKNGNVERAAKHFIIAANLGHEDSMKLLWNCYSDGLVSKTELDATLRAHKAAIDATKSAQRDEGEAYFREI
jgi:TPR repeat protein